MKTPSPRADAGASHRANVPPAAARRPFRSSLAAGAAAGALVGLLLGAADAYQAWQYFRALPEQALTPTAPVRGWDLALGTLGGALLYGPAIALVGALWGALMHPLTARRSAGALRGWLFALLFAAAAAPALFWWTREAIHPGLPALSSERLLVLAGFGAGALCVGAVLGALCAKVPVRAWRVLGVMHVLIWIAGGAYVVSDGRASAERGVINARNGDLPNVLFILVDALRADSLGCYGNSTVATPHIDRLAREGTLFERALVQAPYTWTSFGSFFTGKYPRRHGLLKMMSGQRLEENVTLQQHLKTATRRDGVVLRPEDYSGAAFMTGALSHGSGLADGFDGYVELMKGHPFVDLDSRFSQLRSAFAGPGILFKLRAKQDPDFLANEARRWLEQRQERRFSTFVHLYSTHTPYDPPEPWRGMYVDPQYDGPIDAFYASSRQAIERGAYKPTDADARQILNLYLGGVSQADHHVGILIAELEAQGVLDDTVVIVTSDHGEDFGEGGRWEHNHMYNSNLHVPLIVRWPRAFPAGTRVRATVESIDLFPTLADALKLELPPESTPRDRVDGTSLLPLVRGEVDRVRDFFFAEDSTFVAIQDERTMLVLERFAVRPDGWQIALERKMGRIRMHDLGADPLQRRELFREVVFGAGGADGDSARRLEVRDKVLAEADRLRVALLAWDAHMPIDVEDVVRSARDLETEDAQLAQRAADLARLRAEGVQGADETARRMAALGYTSQMDEYQGELRDLVLERRAAVERAAAESRSP